MMFADDYRISVACAFFFLTLYCSFPLSALTCFSFPLKALKTFSLELIGCVSRRMFTFGFTRLR